MVDIKWQNMACYTVFDIFPIYSDSWMYFTDKLFSVTLSVCLHLQRLYCIICCDINIAVHPHS